MSLSDRGKIVTASLRSNQQPVIGFLSIRTQSAISCKLWQGAHDVLAERGANLVFLPGSHLHSKYEFYAQRNILYDLIDTRHFDGLIFWSDVLFTYNTPEEVLAFYERYASLPIISIGDSPLDNLGIPKVSINNYHGMYDAVIHLIEDHHYRRIAFIRGPETHTGANERYQAYKDALTKHKIALDPNLVVPGDFSSLGGTAAVGIILDERGLRPQHDFDAVVAANDIMIWYALRAFQERGIRVPQDLAVVGFDDDRSSQLIMPPLTTVRQPLYESGRKAAEALLALLAGESLPDRIEVPAELVIRQSCGCLPKSLSIVSTNELAEEKRESLETWGAEQRADWLAELAPLLGATEITTDWLSQLLDALLVDLASAQDNVPSAVGTFVITLNEILYQVVATGGDFMTAWQMVLSRLYQALWPYMNATQAKLASQVFRQAHILVGDTALLARANQQVQVERETDISRGVAQALSTSLDVEEMTNVLVDNFPQLKIKDFYFSLYEDPSSPTTWAKLVLAYTNHERLVIDNEKRRFPSRQFVPADLLPAGQRYSLVAIPLYFKTEQLGFAIFDARPQDGKVYEVLGRALSVALRSTSLLHMAEVAKETALQARNAVETEKTRAEEARKLAEAAKEEAEYANQQLTTEKANAEKAREEAEIANRALEAQVWQANGIAQLNMSVRGEQSVSELGRSVIRQLCQYLNVLTGVIYLREDDVLRFVGGYAYPDDLMTHCKMGQGPLGEAALSQTSLVFNVPTNQQTLSSGLFKAAPRTILVVPFLYEGETIGVIELGMLTEFTEVQRAFLENALESISIAFKTAQARAQINRLLARTQQ